MRVNLIPKVELYLTPKNIFFWTFFSDSVFEVHATPKNNRAINFLHARLQLAICAMIFTAIFVSWYDCNMISLVWTIDNFYVYIQYLSL